MKTENKIIAEFLGAREYKGTYDMYGLIDTIQDGEDEKHFYKPNEMLFNDSWDWLMVVVDTIHDIMVQPCDGFVSEHRFNVQMWVTQCSIIDTTRNKIVGEGDYGTELESTYHAVIEFIEWWGDNKV